MPPFYEDSPNPQIGAVYMSGNATSALKASEGQTPFYVVTTHFNPHMFRSRVRLYRDFVKHMQATGATVFTVEAAFGDHPFEVTSAGNPLNLQLRTNTVLWHKERMINLGVQRLREVDPNAKTVAWVDADVTFSNPNWVDESRHKLMHHPIIQPFSTAASLDAREEVLWTCPSSFKSFITGRGFHQEPPVPNSQIYKGHPGLAWAATMEALNALGGLYDVCIAGSADTVMSNCLKGGWDVYLPGTPSEAVIRSIKRWSNRCNQFVRGNIGYTNGTCMHHWHGKSEERGYEKRWAILSFHNFDPDEDLVLDSQGLYRWAGNKPRLEDDMRLSLGARNEDA